MLKWLALLCAVLSTNGAPVLDGAPLADVVDFHKGLPGAITFTCFDEVGDAVPATFSMPKVKAGDIAVIIRQYILGGEVISLSYPGGDCLIKCELSGR